MWTHLTNGDHFPLVPCCCCRPTSVHIGSRVSVATPPGVVTGLAIKGTCLWRKRAMEENGLFLCKTSSWGYKWLLDQFLGLYLHATFARACCCLPSVRASFGEALCLLQSWLNRWLCTEGWSSHLFDFVSVTLAWVQPPEAEHAFPCVLHYCDSSGFVRVAVTSKSSPPPLTLPSGWLTSSRFRAWN